MPCTCIKVGSLWGHIKNIHLHAIWFHIKNIHLRKTKTNTNPDPNWYRRHCPDPNARIQKKELQIKMEEDVGKQAATSRQ